MHSLLKSDLWMLSIYDQRSSDCEVGKKVQLVPDYNPTPLLLLYFYLFCVNSMLQRKVVIANNQTSIMDDRDIDLQENI